MTEGPIGHTQKNRQTETGEVAVIGAGIVGVCCAINLQKQGFKVTLIDKKGVAEGCSKGNAGHFATEQVFPLAEGSLLAQLPAMLLQPDGPVSIRFSYFLTALPWFGRFLLNMLPRRFRQNTEALKTINAEALPAWEALLKEAQLTHMLVKNGSLLTFESTKRSVIAKLKQRFVSHGVSVMHLDKQDAKSLEPELSENIESALFFPEVGHTSNPERLCKALFGYFTALGGAFIKESAHCIKHSEDGVNIRAGHSVLAFNKVVVAAGAWSKRLLTPLGYKLPLDAERGYHLMLEEYSGMSRPVASYERKMIMTPMSSGLRLAGTVEFAGLYAKSNMNRALILGGHAENLLEDLRCGTVLAKQCWMGMRPSLPDSLPVIGQAPKHNNIYLALGHQHLGLTQAAITGNLIAQLMLKQTTSIDVTPFCLSRFN